MSIDTQEKRMATTGVGRPFLRAAFPTGSPDEEWRINRGHGYGGNALTPTVTPSTATNTWTPDASGRTWHPTIADRVTGTDWENLTVDDWEGLTAVQWSELSGEIWYPDTQGRIWRV